MLGDFNLTTGEPNLKNLTNSFDSESFLQIPTCYKSSASPISIDLILINERTLTMKSAVFKTGMSDFHKLRTTILRKTVSKGNVKKVFYKDYNAFDQNSFENRLNQSYRLFSISVYVSKNIK